jgi:putative endonuclease
MTKNEFYVYILTNKYNTVLYTGLTNNLNNRIIEHRSKRGSKFTAKYNVNKLVYYECFLYVTDAIAREKQLKSGSRQKKIDLIEKTNKNWEDLFPI